MGRSQYGMSPKKILEVRIPLKELAPAVILVFNSIVWFTLIVALFNDSIQKLALPLGETLILHGMYYAGIAISAIF